MEVWLYPFDARPRLFSNINRIENLNGIISLVRPEQTDQEVVAGLCACSAARIADKITAIVRAKSTMRLARVFRMLWLHAFRKTKTASPIAVCLSSKCAGTARGRQCTRPHRMAMRCKPQPDEPKSGRDRSRRCKRVINYRTNSVRSILAVGRRNGNRAPINRCDTKRRASFRFAGRSFSTAAR